MKTVKFRTSRAALTDAERQALAVYRSKACSLSDWVKALRDLLKKQEKDPTSRTSLQGVLLRMDPLAEGDMAEMYGAGEDSIAVEDLGLLGPANDPWGVTVIEGAEMDEYAKARLFALDTILYLDSVKRRREALEGRHFPPCRSSLKKPTRSSQVFLAAQPPINPPPHQAKARSRKRSSTSSAMGANTGCSRTFWCKPSPKRRMVSCPPAATCSLIKPRTPRTATWCWPISGAARKASSNTETKRYLARIPREYAIVKLGYSTEVNDMEPMLIHPLMIRAREPSDAEIQARLNPIF
jgi:hypothetical protein